MSNALHSAESRNLFHNPRPIVDFGILHEYDASCALSNNMLPFAEEIDNRGWVYWKTPDFSKCADPMKAADDFGIRSATAWAVMVSHLGTNFDITLPDIISSKEFQSALNRDCLDPQHSAANQFLWHVMRLTWTLGQLVSPAQLVSDAEITIKSMECCYERTQ
jgi:hypothetical protein